MFEHIDAHLAPIRDRYATLTADPSIVHDALAVGAVRARDIATGVLSRVKRRVGLRAKAANA